MKREGRRDRIVDYKKSQKRSKKIEQHGLCLARPVSKKSQQEIRSGETTHIIGVPLNPAFKIGKVTFGGASVQDVTAGVAVIHGSVDQVCLALQHTDTIIQLMEEAQGLIGSGVVGD